MCILFFAIEQHPKYPVIICANRDEFHQRPSQKMHLWPAQQILAGKDLAAGGTWLGLDLQGNFAALTNFRQGDKLDASKKSRGDLALKALEILGAPSETPNKLSQFSQALETNAEQYNGYNLIYGPLQQLACFDSVNKRHHKLSAGFHSICNGALDDIWPKMARGQQQLEQLILTHAELPIEQLFTLMTNPSQAEPEQLPSTGISQTWEQMLSSIFIVSPEYGTRTTTLITLSDKGEVTIYDRSYTPEGEVTQPQSFVVTPSLKQYKAVSSIGDNKAL